jgi:hypothetical protein
MEGFSGDKNYPHSSAKCEKKEAGHLAIFFVAGFAVRMTNICYSTVIHHVLQKNRHLFL